MAFGLKFDAKGVIDCFEKELETLPSGMKRDIDFKMIEGDFQLFEGKWSILQVGFLFLPLLLEFFWIQHKNHANSRKPEFYALLYFASIFQMLDF